MDSITPTSPRRVHDLLTPWVISQPTALALRDATLSLTYAELDRQSVEMATQLEQSGIRAGDRVLVVGENCVALCVVFLALSKLNAWAVVVNARLSDREIDQFIEHAGARRVLYLSDASAQAAGHARRHGASELASALGSVAIGRPARDSEVEPVFADPARQVAALVYTSGTSGAPKGVMLTHANLIFVAESARDLRGLSPRDVLYGVLPMAHVVGLSTQFLGAMCSGATLLLEPRFTPEGAARALQLDGVTVFTGVPALFARLLEWAHKKAVRINAPRLRLVSVAGSPLTPSLKGEIECEFALTLQNGYGLTESGPTIAQTRIDLPRTDCSVGPPVPGVEIRIVDALHGDVAAGEVGELWVRSPGVMLGYYRNPELTASVLDAAGWFNTGDMVRCEPDDHLFISGRTRELIIRSGFNVYPLEVEQVLNGYPGVVQSAVVGREAGHNEEIVAFVETGDAEIDIDLLRAHLRSNLSPYKQPSEIRVMAALPSLPSGKIQKNALREIAKTPFDAGSSTCSV